MTDSSLSSDALEPLASFLNNCLEETRERLPSNARTAYEKAKKKDCTSTARIFLDTSDSAWYAYYLAQSKKKSKKSDERADAKRIVQQLELLTVVDRKAVAGRIKNMVDVSAPVQGELGRLSKRRRTCDDPATTSGSFSETTVAPSFLGVRSQNITTASPEAVQHSANPAYNAGGSYGSVPFLTTPPPSVSLLPTVGSNETRTPNGYVEDELLELLDYPPFARLAGVFPQRFCRAVRASPPDCRAHITVVFPKTPPEHECDRLITVTFHIVGDRLPWLARQLYNVELEENGGYWCVIFESGTRLSASYLKLDGSSKEGIASALGDQISQAIETGPIRQNEVNMAQVGSYCVELSLGTSCKDDGVLKLVLGYNAGWDVRDKLFPS